MERFGLKMWMCEEGFYFERVSNWRLAEMPGYSCVNIKALLPTPGLFMRACVGTYILKAGN